MKNPLTFKAAVPTGQRTVLSRRERAPLPRIVGVQRACECGRLRSASAEACPRCLWLDGERGLRRAVIEALRLLVRATVDELAKECEAWAESVQRVVGAMLEDRRVSRVWEEFEWEHDASPGVAGRFGERRVAGRWSYALSG